MACLIGTCGKWHLPGERCGSDTPAGLKLKAMFEARRAAGLPPVASPAPVAPKAEAGRLPAVASSPSPGVTVSRPVGKGKGGRPRRHADRAAYKRAYMREYMARRRAEARGAK